MEQARAILLNEIRYAERLCQRTARLYRRLQTAATMLAVLGGSAAVTLVSSTVPQWLGLGGMVLFALFSAFIVAVRPADRAALNEADVRRYAMLRVDAHGMDEAALAAAFAKAKVGDAPEVEPLRMVAFNDVMRETGNYHEVQPLGPLQRALAALA